MRIECYSWSDVNEQILEQAIALQNSAFEDMKGNFYQVDIPYNLVLAIDDNQVIICCFSCLLSLLWIYSDEKSHPFY